jgi:hypothetical protein
MSNLTDNPPADGDEIDMDRIIVDPDYRRRVIARLRDDRRYREAAHYASPGPARQAGDDGGAADRLD